MRVQGKSIEFLYGFHDVFLAMEHEMGCAQHRAEFVYAHLLPDMS